MEEERFLSADLFALINGEMTQQEFKAHWGEFEYHPMDALFTTKDGENTIYVE